MRKKASGWPGESERHALSSRGIKTTAKGLKKWERAKNYSGKDLSDYYPIYSINRDSCEIDKSNWDAIWDELKDYDGVEIHRFNHWAVGWIEQILIHEDDEEALDVAEDILAILDNYPLLNEDDYSIRMHEGALNNIQSSHSMVESQDDAEKVYRFLSDYGYYRELEEYDGMPAYPSDEAIEDALIYYKIIEDFDYPDYIDDKTRKDIAGEAVTDSNILSKEDKEELLHGDMNIKDVHKKMGFDILSFHPDQKL